MEAGDHMIHELIQYKMLLKQDILNLKREVKLKELDLKYTEERIELLSINQLEIDFDESK